MKMMVKLQILLVICMSISCSRLSPKIEIVEIKNKQLNIIEKGVTVNKIREGYWITISDKNIIVIESYYIKGKQNGPIKMYYDDGKLMSLSYMQDGKENGIRISYYYNGIIRDIGMIRNDENEGNWTFYSKKGKVDKIIFYKNGVGVLIKDNHLSVPVPGM